LLSYSGVAALAATVSAIIAAVILFRDISSKWPYVIITLTSPSRGGFIDSTVTFHNRSSRIIILDELLIAQTFEFAKGSNGFFKTWNDGIHQSTSSGVALNIAVPPGGEYTIKLALINKYFTASSPRFVSMRFTDAHKRKRLWEKEYVARAELTDPIVRAMIS
jgi:hypothetical protein